MCFCFITFNARFSCAHRYSRTPKRVHLGGITTSHHSLSLTFTGGAWLFEDESSSEETSSKNEHSVNGGGADEDEHCATHEYGEGAQDMNQQIDEHGPSAPPPSEGKSVDALRSQFKRLGTTGNDNINGSSLDADEDIEDDDITRLDEVGDDIANLDDLPSSLHTEHAQPAVATHIVTSLPPHRARDGRPGHD